MLLPQTAHSTGDGCIGQQFVPNGVHHILVDLYLQTGGTQALCHTLHVFHGSLQGAHVGIAGYRRHKQPCTVERPAVCQRRCGHRHYGCPRKEKVQQIIESRGARLRRQLLNGMIAQAKRTQKALF